MDSYELCKIMNFSEQDVILKADYTCM